MSLFHTQMNKQEDNILNENLNIEKEKQDFMEQNKILDEDVIKIEENSKSKKEGKLSNLEGSSNNVNVINEVEKKKDELAGSFPEVKGNVEKTEDIYADRYLNERYVKANHISLYKGSFTKEKEKDSAKMKAIKRAIKRYLEVRTTVTAPLVLQSVIEACNEYTKGKVGFLKFGEAKERLNEVKAVREAALMELRECNAIDKKLSPEELKERKNKRREVLRNNEEFYAPEIKAHNKKVASQSPEKKREYEEINNRKYQLVKGAMANLKSNYPGLSDKDAQNLVLKHIKNKDVTSDSINFKLLDKEVGKKAYYGRIGRLKSDRVEELMESYPAMKKKDAIRIAVKEYELGRTLKHDNIINEFKGNYAFKVKDSFFEKQLSEKIREELKDKYNVVTRLFAGTIGYEFVKNNVLKDWLVSAAFAHDVEIIEEKNVAKKDLDYESTFI